MRPHPRRWLILIALCLSTLVLVIDNMALTVAVPALSADLGATAQDIQWILESYMLVFAGLLLTAGSLSDRYGRRKVMVVGLTLFGAASLVATFATSPGELIAARVAMGVGGSLIMPSNLSIMINVFTDEAERRKAMAAGAAFGVLGLVGGPVLGGALVASLGWEAVFWINVPVAALAVTAALALMPESRGPVTRPDPLGAVLSVIGMSALVWTINELAHGVAWIQLVIAVVALSAFVVWELRTEHPMVPLRLFRDRDFAGGSLSMTLVQVGNGGLLLVLTQYMQFVLGYSSTQAGLAFIPMFAASMIFNGVGAALGTRLGNRTTAVLGMVVMAGGFGLLGLSSADSFAILAVAQAVLGAGSGLAMPSAVIALMGAVPAERAGAGSALNNTIQQAGAALGVAVLGSLATSGYASAMPAGAPEEARRSVAAAVADPSLSAVAREAYGAAMSYAFLGAAAGVLAAAVLALLLLRGRRVTAGTPSTTDESRILVAA
ncbi:EmrB/QacA subfamily drug resistance transporter [Nonomuraea thailandensis]|uniref:EmrB/QacA subfamily drug resistance transporter n=1 Tax=Nonomuraea thailandensis TaxID=1188745 RepID=A0A9X2GYC5_9ACTN|nr:MFS transporter [Nonomuraea thailandensis]MCP2364051.1 EmrB/QacA subfamily drug resistance transporter [Nonomuraea thailandensis]